MLALNFSPKNSFLRRHGFAIALALLLLLYFACRLLNLLIIPIFADEAIYLYWSQLISSEPSRYLFYPLNDGKTPLFIWLLLPFIKFFSDPLFAGRFLTIFFGAAQLILQVKLTSLFIKSRLWQYWSGLLIIFLPGLIFNQRLALMDTALTFFLTLCFYYCFLVGMDYQKKRILSRSLIIKTFLAGLSLILAFWTKFSALLFLPTLMVLSCYFIFTTPKSEEKNYQRFSLKQALTLISLFVSIAFLGLLGLALLKVSPLFGQIFARGGDFLYPLAEFLAHPLEIVARNIIFFLAVLQNYVTPPLLLALIIFLLCSRKRATTLWMLFCALSLITPIIILGKQVYPRYFLPVLPFLVLTFTLAAKNSFLPKIFKAMPIFIIALWGINFYYLAITTPWNLPLVPADQSQFFEQWSAGYGIREALSLLETAYSEGQTLVLTEGHIGTLPDGLQVYLSNHPLRNHYRVEGIGMVNEGNLADFLPLFAAYQRVLLLVNSHRLEITERNNWQLIAQFPRPDANSPSLQVWQLQ